MDTTIATAATVAQRAMAASGAAGVSSLNVALHRRRETLCGRLWISP